MVEIHTCEIYLLAFAGESFLPSFLAQYSPPFALTGFNPPVDKSKKAKGSSLGKVYYLSLLAVQLNTKTTKSDIMQIANDFARIWSSTNVSFRDKKRMIRLLIEDVTVKNSDKKVMQT